MNRTGYRREGFVQQPFRSLVKLSLAGLLPAQLLGQSSLRFWVWAEMWGRGGAREDTRDTQQ